MFYAFLITKPVPTFVENALVICFYAFLITKPVPTFVENALDKKSGRSKPQVMGFWPPQIFAPFLPITPVIETQIV